MPAKLSEKERIRLIGKVVVGGEPVSKVCREAGISRVLFYRFLKRYKEEGTVAPKKPSRVSRGRVPESYVARIIELVKTYPSWSTKKVSGALGKDKRGRPLVGNHGVQNVFTRLNLNTAQKRREFAKVAKGVALKKKPVALELSPAQRLQAIEQVVKYNKPVAQVCRDFGISRPNLYKWLKRYQTAPEDKKLEALEARKPKPARYYRQTPEKYEEAVLSVVAQYPDFGVARIVETLPQIAGKPIVGHHGVQNILRRHDLSTFEKRLAYAQAQITPVTRLISALAELGTRFIILPAETRARIIRFAGATFITAFLTIVVLGGVGYFATITAAAPVPSQIGLIFASVALAVGSLFFAYSMKYYLTLALVLSFSRQPQEEGGGYAIGLNGRFARGQNANGNGPRAGGWLQRIFGLHKGNGPSVGQKSEEVYAPGLTPSLEHVKLERYPFVSIHLPFYNERRVANRILSACTSFDYPSTRDARSGQVLPNYEVIVCDDSTDETVKIVKQWEKTFGPSSGRGHPKVKVIHRETREGFKGGALKEAVKHMDPRTEFVLVFDADFVPYPDTIQQFLRYFKASGGWSEEKDYQQGEIITTPYKTFEKVKIDENLQRKLATQEQRLLKASPIACVAGYQWHVLNKSENWVTRGVRTEYAGSYVIERPGQEILGALKIIHGSVYMIRADILKHFGWGTSITEDFELTLRIYEKGFKVAYTPYIQAPSECVSRINRLIRQRMRWSEGHSFNVKKMFSKLIANPNLSPIEKLEFLYISPYYLQAFFFLIGTFSWLVSETLFPARLPFWTSLWGWSLVLTNFFALPLMNGVGLFLEEAEEKDYLGILSFIALSYLLVPFQAYSSVKGFIEDKEGPWFRTPKTGKITDIFTRGRFYRWISGILPGFRPAAGGLASARLVPAPAFEWQRLAGEHLGLNPYLALTTANNRFNFFRIKPRQLRWIGRIFLATLLIFSTGLLSLAPAAPYFIKPKEVKAQEFGMLAGNEQTLLDGDFKQKEVVKQEQDLNWGVLAINTNKSVYQPDETAKLAMAVLDEQGKMVCDARLELRITNYELGITNELSTENGKIKVNQECYLYDVNFRPDFEAEYQVGGRGKYEMELTAETKNGRFQVSDSFEVRDFPAFDIERDTATRIYPVKNYQVNIKIKANQDFKGEVRETVPNKFSIFNDQKIITWQVDWQKGKTYELNYQYDAPDKSPEFYQLGPLIFREEGKTVFQEARQWQIASDLTCVSAATGDWNVQATWTGCGANGPVTGDIVQIGVHTITVTADAQAASVDFTALGGGLTVNTGVVLTLSGALTLDGALNADTSATVGGAGSISAAAIQVGTAVPPTKNATYTRILTSTITSLTALGNLTITSSIGANNLKIANSTFQLSSGTTTVNGTVTTVNENAVNVSTFTMATGDQSGTLNLGGGTPWSLSGTGTNTITLNGTSAVVNYNSSSAQTPLATTYTTLKSNNTAGLTMGGAFTTTNLTIGDVTSASIFSDGGNTLTATGTLTMSNSGTYNLGSAGTATTFPGFATRTLAAGTTIGYVATPNQTVSSTPAYQNLTISGGGTKTMTGVTSVAGNFTATGGTAIPVLNTISGNFLVNGATVTTGANLAVTGNTTLSSGSLSLGNFTFSTGSLTVSAGTITTVGYAFTVSGTTTVNGGTLTLNNNTGNKLLQGAVAVSSGILNGASTAIQIENGITQSSTGSVAITGTTTFQTNAAQALGGTIAIATLSVSDGVTLTNNGTLTVSTALSGAGGFTNGATGVLNYGSATAPTVTIFTMDTAGNTMNYTGTSPVIRTVAYHHLGITGSGTVTGANFTVTTIAGNLTISGSVSVTTGAALAVTGITTVGTGTSLIIGAFVTSMPNITVTSTGTCTNNGTLTISGTLSVTTVANGFTNNGTVTVTTALSGAGSFVNAATGVLNYGATAVPAITNLTTTDVGNTVNYTGDSPVIRTVAYHHLGVTGSGTVTGANFTVTTIAGNLTIGGSVSVTTGAALAVTGITTIGTGTSLAIGAFVTSMPNITVTDTGTFTNGGTLTVTTTLTGTGTFTQGTNATLNLGGTCGINTLTATADNNTVTYNGGSAQNIKNTTYHDLNIQPSADSVTSIFGTDYSQIITVQGNLVIGNGTNTAVIVEATTYDPDISVTGNVTVSANTTFTNSDLSTATLNIDGNLTINSGSPANGSFTAPAGTEATAFTLAGNFTNNGTFTHNLGTITFDDNTKTSTLAYGSAAITFNNFTVSTGSKTIVFETDYRTNIIGTLTINGSSCDTLIRLISDSSGTKFEIDATGSKSVQYAYIKDSNAITAASATNSSSGDNNTGWTITGTCGGTVADITAWSFQRKTFFDDGDQFYWRFSFDEPNGQIKIEYNQTPWDAAWTATTALNIATNDFSVWEDGIFVYIVYAENDDIKVRKGTLEAGSIAWDTTDGGVCNSGVCLVLDGTAVNTYKYAYITKDSGNLLWVMARNYDGTNYVMKAVRSTVADNPQNWGSISSLSAAANDNANTYGTLSSLGSNNMYAVWTKGTAIEGRKYSSGAWAGDPADTIGTGGTGLENNFCLSSDTSNNLHLAYIDGSNLVQYKKYNGTAWDVSATRIDTNGGMSYVTVSVDTANNDVYVIYIKSSTGAFYYSKYSGSWTNEVAPSSPAWNTDTTNKYLTSNYADSGRIFGMWTSGSGPYSLNWNYIFIPERIWLLLGLGLVIPRILRKIRLRRRLRRAREK